MLRRLLPLLSGLALVAVSCDGGSGETENKQTPASQCPKVSMDALAGQWIQFSNSRPVKENRFEVVKTNNNYELWYTGGGFTKKRMMGERRSNDIMFTQAPDATNEKAFKAGNMSLVRLYVEPRPKDCSLRVSEMRLERSGDKEVEKAVGPFTTYVEYPENQPKLTYRYCDDVLFLGDAATDRAVAQKQVEENGAPNPAHPLDEAIPVAAWIKASDDGDESCAYDMDLYFDDVAARDKEKAVREKVSAGEVKDGYRHYYVPDWYAPYSGNHHFQIYRYRTCADQNRELIGVACLEAIL